MKLIPRIMHIFQERERERCGVCNPTECRKSVFTQPPIPVILTQILGKCVFFSFITHTYTHTLGEKIQG